MTLQRHPIAESIRIVCRLTDREGEFVAFARVKKDVQAYGLAGLPDVVVYINRYFCRQSGANYAETTGLHLESEATVDDSAAWEQLADRFVIRAHTVDGINGFSEIDDAT